MIVYDCAGHIAAAAVLTAASRVETEILPHCQGDGIGVIVYSPMASGSLTGAMNRDRIANLPKDDWRKGHSDFNAPNLSRHLALVDI